METKEHIDSNGHLRVPVDITTGLAPPRAGWDQFFVAFRLNGKPAKWFIYKPIKGAARARVR